MLFLKTNGIINKTNITNILKMKKKIKQIAIPLILFAVLYFSVSFNKEYIRPFYGDIPFWGILTGSFSNFMAAFIISIIPFTPIILKKFSVKKSRLIVYISAISVFLILTLEEFTPIVDASITFDIYDIIASGIGSIIAILIFEIFIIRHLKK